eukprot:13055911-Alexandrium_andersonii.AAC.1
MTELLGWSVRLVLGCRVRTAHRLHIAAGVGIAVDRWIEGSFDDPGILVSGLACPERLAVLLLFECIAVVAPAVCRLPLPAFWGEQE